MRFEWDVRCTRCVEKAHHTHGWMSMWWTHYRCWCFGRRWHCAHIDCWLLCRCHVVLIVFHRRVLFVGWCWWCWRWCHVRFQFNSILNARPADRIAALLVFQPKRSIITTVHASCLTKSDATKAYGLQSPLEVLVTLRIHGTLSFRCCLWCCGSGCRWWRRGLWLCGLWRLLWLLICSSTSCDIEKWVFFWFA